MTKITDSMREDVLNKLSSGRKYRKIGRVTYKIENHTYHIKAKTGNLNKYPFNINNAVLAADFEVYICGNSSQYYVIPIHLIKKMHDNSDALPDYSHPGLTVVDVYPDEDIIVYGRGGKSINVGEYRNPESDQSVVETQNPENIKHKYGSGGEGIDHKQLKLWVTNNPNFINVTSVNQIELETHKFPSNDLPDIVFQHGKGLYTIVEIETNNPLPGAWQLIKYRALLAAELEKPIDNDKIRSVLVAWKFPSNVQEFCNKHYIEFFSKRL